MTNQLNEEQYDVIIIGAGPAGLKCAETLGGSNLKVLLLEKNEIIGPKVCAGGLTIKDLAYLKLPQEIIEYEYKTIKILVKNDCLTINHHQSLVSTIDRKDFGQWQLGRVKKFANVKIITKALVSEINKEYVVVNDQNIGYKYLVGADGAMSIVRNYLKMKSKNICLAMQYIIPNNDYRELKIFFNSKYFAEYYAWIFPHKDYVSVGCGSDARSLPPQELKANFHKWLEEEKIDVSNAKYEAFAINPDYEGFKFGNIFLVGDAGGFASALTGEGIFQAMVSGEEAGKCILNPRHKTVKIAGLLKSKKRHNRIVNLLRESGPLRTMFFRAFVFYFSIPYFRHKWLARSNSIADQF